jgi:hypothetical protein
MTASSASRAAGDVAAYRRDVADLLGGETAGDAVEDPPLRAVRLEARHGRRGPDPVAAAAGRDAVEPDAGDVDRRLFRLVREEVQGRPPGDGKALLSQLPERPPGLVEAFRNKKIPELHRCSFHGRRGIYP